MDRRSVPEHQEPGSDVSDQVLEKLDGVQTIQKLLMHQDRNPTGWCNTTYNREMVAGLPDAKNECTTFGGVCPNNLSRQKVKARFVHENQGPALTTGLGVKAGPDLQSPALDFLFFTLTTSCNGHLRSPSEFLREQRDLAFVIGDTELFFDNLGDSSTGPDLARKAICFRPVSEEVWDQSGPLRFKPGRAAGNRLCVQRVGPIAMSPSQPTADSSLASIESSGNLTLVPAGLLQMSGSQTPPLPPIS